MENSSVLPELGTEGFHYLGRGMLEKGKRTVAHTGAARSLLLGSKRLTHVIANDSSRYGC